jgi:hypothetical protein
MKGAWEPSEISWLLIALFMGAIVLFFVLAYVSGVSNITVRPA